MIQILNLNNLYVAFDALEKTMNLLSNSQWISLQPPELEESLLSGAIQNFEVMYELCVKTLRRQLEMVSDTPVEIDQMDFRTMLRTAAEKGFLNTVEPWFEYRKMRNITAHSYDHEKALLVYQGIPDFILQVHELLTILEIWNKKALNQRGSNE
ncbi:MAG: HI0074 family nucleotidyltransferase substrate-binding subunit [Pseudomonadota bacterium]